MVEEKTFEMTPLRLATVTDGMVRRAKREIARRIRAALNDVNGEKLLAELVMELDPMPVIVDPVRENAEPEPLDTATLDLVEDDQLPPVRHMDDFDEGKTLVQGGMHRRAVIGYNGATGNLRPS